MKEAVSEITKHSAWKKTSSFIQEKFGKKIDFKFLALAAGPSEKAGSKFFYAGDDLVVRLKYKQKNLGSVAIERGATLSQAQQLEAIDLIQFLIEPQVYNQMLQLNIQSLSRENDAENDAENENVIRLFPLPARAPIENERAASDAPAPRRLVSKFIHVKAKSSLARHKIAMKIHEMCGTIVLLRIQDIYSGLEPLEREMDLTDTALYVEDLQTLNENQLFLLEKLALHNDAHNSVIIVGSGLSDDEVRHLNCSVAMKHDLLGLSYDADRVPVSQQSEEDVLDLLFFNDSDTMS